MYVYEYIMYYYQQRQRYNPQPKHFPSTSSFDGALEKGVPHIYVGTPRSAL